MVTTLIGRYYEGQGNAVAAVAVVTEGLHWAAYICGVPNIPLEKVDHWAATLGCKLPVEDAKYFFQKEEFVSLPYDND